MAFIAVFFFSVVAYRWGRSDGYADGYERGYDDAHNNVEDIA